MVSVLGNEHCDTSSNPGLDCAFYIMLIALVNVRIE